MRKQFTVLFCLAFFASSSLTGCSLTLPVKGTIVSTSEPFTGTATGYMDGGGTLKVTLQSGVICTGNFVYTSSREGKGVFNCDDQRSGPFEFVSTGNRGNGRGVLSGQHFVFTFGKF